MAVMDGGAHVWACACLHCGAVNTVLTAFAYAVGMVPASCVYTEPAGEVETVRVEMLPAALIVRELLVSVVGTTGLFSGCVEQPMYIDACVCTVPAVCCWTRALVDAKG